MVFRWLSRKFAFAFEGNRLSPRSVDAAIEVIERRGMKAHLYLPGVGHREDEELSYALDTLGAAGFIVTTAAGALIGRVATHGLSSEQIAEQRRAEFKVID